jgi:hypothetical protein
MEPYPYHYSCRNKPEESVDPNMRILLEELQRMEARLSDKIEGRCGGFEQRVLDSKQKVEEHGHREAI